MMLVGRILRRRGLMESSAGECRGADENGERRSEMGKQVRQVVEIGCMRERKWW